MSGSEPPPSLEDLDARLKKARGARQTEPRAPSSAGGLAQALRLAMEMVAALAVGGMIGWGLDRWLDTGPWLLLVFLVFGSAAGVHNAYRTASQVSAAAARNDDGSERPGSE